MTTATKVRTWTTVGEVVMDKTLEDGAKLSRKRVEAAIEAMDWQAPKRDGGNGAWTLAMMPGEGIKTVIKEFRIPRVYELAVSNELAPYGFYGIKGRYKNGAAEIYVVDLGTELTPVCSDFTEEEVAV